MKILSEDAFGRTESFIRSQGRQLEQALFDFHFRDGLADVVLRELAVYQNEDGGFGHALEPDLRTSASSAIATSQAFHTLQAIDANADEPLVQRGVEYLLATLDRTRLVWPIVPPAVEDAPHAPWWSYPDIETNFGGFVLNPRASLTAQLYRYANLVPPQLLEELTRDVLDTVANVGATMEQHDLACVLELAGARNVPPQAANNLWGKLRAVAAASVESDPSKWTTYCLMPLQVAPGPDSVLADALSPEVIAANLDWIIDRQLPDGSWPLPWSWAQVDQEAWNAAEREWKGMIALHNLVSLRAYGWL